MTEKMCGRVQNANLHFNKSTTHHLVAAAGLELSDMKTITFSVSYNSKI